MILSTQNSLIKPLALAIHYSLDRYRLNLWVQNLFECECSWVAPHPAQETTDPDAPVPILPLRHSPHRLRMDLSPVQLELVG